MSLPFTTRQPPQFPLCLSKSRLPCFPSHNNDHNSNMTILTVPNVDNVHHYELVQLAWVQITYLDPSLQLVSTLHSLGFFPCPDLSICYARTLGTFLSALWHLDCLLYGYGIVRMRVAIPGTL